MNNTTLYLIRHGEAEGNITMRSHGITDTDLTPHGREQARLLGKRFEGVRLDCVFASYLRRARLTARELALPRGLQVMVIPELHEVSMGIFEDCTWHEVKQRFPVEAKAWNERFYDYRIPCGESYADGGARMKNAVLSLLRENAGKSMAAVSHAMAIRSFLVETGNAQLAGYSGNTAVTCVDYDSINDTMSVRYANDIAHLPGGSYIALDDTRMDGEGLDSYCLSYEPCFEPESVSPQGTITGYQLGELAGRVSYAVKGCTVEIFDLFIEENMRNNGYASQLLGEAAYRGERLGAKIARMHATAENGGVAHVLEKNGYKKAADGSFEKLISDQ